MQIAEAPTGEKRERNCGNLKLYLPYVERFHRTPFFFSILFIGSFNLLFFFFLF